MRTIIVIGGGAAGLMAALAASGNPERRVVLLERQARVGRKLLATGNGRCNLSNLHAAPEHYFGSDASFVAPALRAFGPEDTLSFFRTLGLLTRTEADGKVYPYSNQAGSVLDVLRFAAEARSNIDLKTGNPARAAARTKTGFLVETAAGPLPCDRLLVAAGGAASPDLGGTEDGYRLLERFGHTCTPLFPALVQIKTDNTYPRALKGIKTDAGVTLLLDDGTVLAHSLGEVLFTEYGVSGPAVFALSRHSAVCKKPLQLQLDLMPEWAEGELLTLLQARRAAAGILPAEQYLTGVLNKRLGQMIMKSRGIAFTRPAAELTDAEIGTIAHAVKAFSLPVTGTTGLQNAQVTAGGIKTGEFHPETMESRLCPGLFAAGEVLDIDGACGGFNLQWAWSSGYLAGRSAAL